MKKSEEWIAPAKINIGLDILYQRLDGYHEIQTIFYRVAEPCDTITVEASDVFRLTCSDPEVPAGFGNLMLSAAERYSALTLEPLPAIHVHLDKRIPIGAGLGGGSSDAATMLKILDRYAPAHASKEEMAALCETLGADVPFFYSGASAALAKGIGERLTPISHSMDATILIVKDPSVSVSTKEAYGGLRITPQTKPADLRQAFLCANNLSEFRTFFRNDFEKTVFERYPSIRELKKDLYNTGANFALMSGSGASVFGLFEQKDIAERAKQIFLARGLQTFLS